MNQRINEILRVKIHESGLDSFIVSKPANLRYLTGFTGDYGFLVVGLSGDIFFASPLYIEQAQSTIGHHYRIIRTNDVFKSFSQRKSSFWGKTVGYEAGFLTCSEGEKLKEALITRKMVATKGITEEFRMIKQPSELEAILKAQRIIEKVYNDILPLMREGVEERDLAIEIHYRILNYGGERPAFDTIVASGPNSSMPHAHPTRRKLTTGDIIILDMGAIVDGYASDMTRTVVLGKATREQKRLYALVLESQKKAFDMVRAGVACSNVDRTARDVIAKAGYKEHFIHSLGHGVGLEVHELPRLTMKNKATLQPGMVITLEPGIYFPGWGGIRIEDMAVVTENGCERLTQTPATLFEL